LGDRSVFVAGRLPDAGVGTFTQAMYDMAVKRGLIVVSMKNDRKQRWRGEKPSHDRGRMGWRHMFWRGARRS
jgi:ABC-type xylose transport system substrate-binding protein